MADAKSPNPIADMTTVSAIKSELKSKLPTISSSLAWNANLLYTRRLAGMRITESRVDMAVMVTESARSALKMLHHLCLLLYMMEDCV